MTTQNIALFKAITAKMDYLDRRQNVLAQNVANADTPSYKPRDLKAVDFSQFLPKRPGAVTAIQPKITNPLHINPQGASARVGTAEQRNTYDVEPSGNAVILEEQMVKASRNTMDYNLMTTLYQKNVSMLRVALGRQG